MFRHLFLKRTYCNSTNVRVRFAPSPTGLLHLGGLRTALYNFLFAKSQGGSFILRIEDTDQTRLVSGASKQLIDDLRWADIVADEGPTIGGNYGPYVQSERIDIYRAEAEKLVRNQSAYYCFCSQNRLDILKKAAVRERNTPKYDNRCRHLSEDEIKSKISAGAEKCIRFKLIPSESYTDLIYGPINHQVHEIEGDPIILKTNGWPTYHLANVVDDHLMNISHVIRGVEWMLSTNKHLMLYHAFGFKPPIFGHLPLLLNPDGSKISKRQGDLTVKALRERGILPRALTNFVLQAGSGFETPVEMTSSQQDLISKFNLTSVATNSCRLPFTKLPEFNREELRRLVENPTERSRLVAEIEDLVAEAFSETSEFEIVAIDEFYIATILQWCLPRITTLSDLVSENFKFLWVLPKRTSFVNVDSELLSDVEKLLMNCDFNRQHLSSSLKDFANSKGIPYKTLMQTLRKVLSSLENGPGVVEMLLIFGKNLAVKRIKRAITVDDSNPTAEVVKTRTN